MAAEREGSIAAVVNAVHLFGLGTPVDVPQFAARGAMGEVYRVTTSSGQYAIKRLFEWNDASGAEREADFTSRARAVGVVTPVEVRGPDGSLLVAWEDQRFRAFTWLELDAPLRPPLPADLLVDIGRVAARLHQAGEPTTEAVDAWYLVPPAEPAWDLLADQLAPSAQSWAASLRQRLPELRELSRCAADAPRPSAWTCHRDLDLTNVLPLTAGGLAVLDWENLGPMAKQHELGYVALEWCAPADDELETRVRLLRDAYTESGGDCGRLDVHSFTVTWVTLLNYVMASATTALDPSADVQHREFGVQAVQNVLGMDLSLAVADRIIAAWNN